MTFNILTGLLLTANFTPADRQIRGAANAFTHLQTNTETVANMQHTNMRAGAFPPIFPKHGARSTELAGFGAGLGLGSQPVMSECVSSDAFTFIAFVNYSHKDIKCKL